MFKIAHISNVNWQHR